LCLIEKYFIFYIRLDHFGMANINRLAPEFVVSYWKIFYILYTPWSLRDGKH